MPSDALAFKKLYSIFFSAYLFWLSHFYFELFLYFNRETQCDIKIIDSFRFESRSVQAEIIDVFISREMSALLIQTERRGHTVTSW